MSTFLDKFLSIVSIHEALDVESAEQTIRKNIRFRGMNVWILACAIVIASIGLNVNSVAVIIGAMLISPLMGPIIGFGLSLGTNNIALLKTSLFNLAIMVSISILASALFFLISPLTLVNQSELLARTNPTIYDVLIAFFGGAAGALEISRKEKGTVISGVAIATALMPPLCTVGYGLSVWDFHYVFGALYLFAINCIFVALATFVVVKYLRYPAVTEPDPVKSRRVKHLAMAILVAMIVPSVFSGVKVVQENNFNIRAAKFVQNHKAIDGVLIYSHSTDPSHKSPSITLHTAGRALSLEEKMLLQSEARQACRSENCSLVFDEASLASGAERDSEFEKQVYQDMAWQLAALRDSLALYQSREIPFESMYGELMAVFPQISRVKIAKGGDSVIAVVTYRSRDDESVAPQLRNWINVRLGISDTDVFDLYPEETADAGQ